MPTSRGILNNVFELRVTDQMMRISTILMVLLLAGLVGGAVFLATWEIPAPSAPPIEKIIPNDQFPS